MKAAWLPAWLAAYDRGKAAQDLVAGVVTILLVPQSLAYAMLAGLPPHVWSTSGARSQHDAFGRSGRSGVAHDRFALAHPGLRFAVQGSTETLVLSVWIDTLHYPGLESIGEADPDLLSSTPS
jgi:hypothetical protein